jgi:hypothetical protein
MHHAKEDLIDWDITKIGKSIAARFGRIALIERSRHASHRQSTEKDESKHGIAPDHGAHLVHDMDDMWGCDLCWHYVVPR